MTETIQNASPLKVYWQRKYTLMLFMTIPIALLTSFVNLGFMIRGLVFYLLFSFMLIAANNFYMRFPQKNAERKILFFGTLTGALVGALCSITFPVILHYFPAAISGESTIFIREIDTIQYSAIVSGAIYGFLIFLSYILRNRYKRFSAAFFPMLFLTCTIGYALSNVFFVMKPSEWFFGLGISAIAGVPNALALFLLFHVLNPFKADHEFRQQENNEKKNISKIAP